MPPQFLNTIEQTAFSTWLRDTSSPFGFWFVLTFHALGLGLAVGASVLIDLRTLGVAKALPMTALKRLYSPLWLGFGVQVVSGLVLLWAFPTKSLTQVLFYAKLAFIAAGMIVTVRIGHTIPAREGEPLDPAKRLAVLSLIFWFSALTAGRFLAYTATYTLYP